MNLHERADLRPVRPDFRPERPDLRPERADLRPERADFRPERADFRHERAWGGRTDGRMHERKSPVFYRTLSPLGPLPKNQKGLMILVIFCNFGHFGPLRGP